MEVLNFLLVCLGYVFIAGILAVIVEAIFNCGENADNPKTATHIYLIIFFVILLIIGVNYVKNGRKFYEKQLKEKEEYVNSLIEESNSLEEFEYLWQFRDWQFHDEEEHDDVN